MGELLKVGKYKGQPLEVLTDDKQYADWLAAQGWFREKFPTQYNFIINNLSEPSETPEHNAMQALFLDPQICLNLFYKTFSKIRAYIIQLEIERLQFETEGGWDVCFEVRFARFCTYPKSKKAEQCISGSHGSYCCNCSDGCYDGDSVGIDSWKWSFCIELKPCLGDDYPAILRQVSRKSRGENRTLVFDTFTARGATLEQVKNIFITHGITVYALSDIYAAS